MTGLLKENFPKLFTAHLSWPEEQKLLLILHLVLLLQVKTCKTWNYSGFVWEKVELTSKNVKRGFLQAYIYINTHSPLFNISLCLSLSLFVFQCLSLIHPQSHWVLSHPWWSVPRWFSEARGVMSIHNSWFHKGRRKNCVWTISSGPPSFCWSSVCSHTHTHTRMVRWMAWFSGWQFKVAEVNSASIH